LDLFKRQKRHEKSTFEISLVNGRGSQLSFGKPGAVGVWTVGGRQKGKTKKGNEPGRTALFSGLKTKFLKDRATVRHKGNKSAI